MEKYSLSHLSDGTLIRDLAALVARDRTTTAALLAYLAEVEERRLYLPAGYNSLYAYCVGELHLCDQAAYKRIQAARAARQCPAIFPAVADGRLHLTAIVLLAPHLTRENADELLAAAAHKTKSEIELLLAQGFPKPDVPAMVIAISPAVAPSPVVGSATQLSPGIVEQPVPVRVEVPTPRPKVTPLAPQRFALQLTMSQSTHDKLCHAQALLGHAIPSGDVAEVLDRALDALIALLEKRKFAATDKPRRSRPCSTANPRYIPAEVKRAVRKRDGERCTFVSEAGHRCEARTRLEFDHIVPVARGGQATLGQVRLRCRAHNQYDAECTFGSGFMSDKRSQARQDSPAAHAVRMQGPEPGSVAPPRSW